jgi:hypothetical protein
MKTILIDDVQYNLPDSWDEVNLETLQSFTKLQETTFETETDKNVEMIQTMSSIPRDLLLQIPIQDFKDLGSMFDWMTSFPDEKKVIAGVSIDSQKYVPINLDTMSMGDWISIEVFQNRPDKEENIHILAAILLRPEIDGKIEVLKDMDNIMKRAELFKKKLMVGDYWPIVQSFFAGAVSSSLNNSPASSRQQKSRLKIVSS